MRLFIIDQRAMEFSFYTALLLHYGAFKQNKSPTIKVSCIIGMVFINLPPLSLTPGLGLLV